MRPAGAAERQTMLAQCLNLAHVSLVPSPFSLALIAVREGGEGSGIYM